MTRIERAFAILLLLSDRRIVTAPDLARRFEVSVRTIYRDVEMLSATGIPVYAERGSGGGYRLLEGFFLPPVAFSRYEAVALLLSLTLARGLKVPPFAAELDSAERKVVAALPNHFRPLLAETRRLIGFERAATDAFHPELPNPAGDGEGESAAEARVVEIFLKAVLDGTRVRFAYRSPYRASPDRPSSPVEAEPLGLLWDRDRWYLIGKRLAEIGAPAVAAQRFWRADRVIAIEPSTFRVASDPDFDVRRHLGRAWLGRAMSKWTGTAPVRIRLRPEQAEAMRTDWYFGFAEFEEVGPDTVVMSFGEDDPARVFELLRWLGPGAELLEPAAWRDRLRDQFRVLAALYS
jgi:predicted DNA-binding transcriptional regulator YafY